MDLLKRIKNMVWTVGEEYDTSVTSSGVRSYTDTENVVIADQKAFVKLGLTEEESTDLVLFASAHEGGHNLLSTIDDIERIMRKGVLEGADIDVLNSMCQIAEDYRVDTTITRNRPGYWDIRKNTLDAVTKLFADSPMGDKTADFFKEVSFNTYDITLKDKRAWKKAVDFDKAAKVAAKLKELATTSKSSGELLDKVYDYYMEDFHKSKETGEGDSGDEGDSEEHTGDSGKSGKASGKEKGESETSDETSDEADGKGDREDESDDVDESEELTEEEIEELIKDAIEGFKGASTLTKILGKKATENLDRAKAPTASESKLEGLKKDAEEFYERYYGKKSRHYKKLWSEQELAKVTKELCQGAHAGTAIAYVRPIDLDDRVRSITELLSRESSLEELNGIARRMSNKLRNILQAEADFEGEIHRSGSRLIANKMWKPVHTSDTNVFYKTTYEEVGNYVIDLVLDASGSQRGRQSDVRRQAYIIAKALDILGIPCRITSYMSDNHVTVLKQLKDFDEPKPQNAFAYEASGENRDGLSLLMANVELLKRKESNRIMIVLSDGAPSDMGGSKASVITHSGGACPYVAYPPSSRHFSTYDSKGLTDSYQAVRTIRKNSKLMGIYVGGVTQLEVEKYIYGNDFAYVGTNMSIFVDIVTKYLVKTIEKSW